VRAFICWIFFAFALTSVAKSAPLSEAELKNLLAGLKRTNTRGIPKSFHQTASAMPTPSAHVEIALATIKGN
jgi:hypothetical protein